MRTFLIDSVFDIVLVQERIMSMGLFFAFKMLNGRLLISSIWLCPTAVESLLIGFASFFSLYTPLTALIEHRALQPAA